MAAWYEPIIIYGGEALSVIFFLIWLYQILRSALKHYRHDREEKASIFVVHFVLLIANGMYLGYEFHQNDIHMIPVEFSMYFFLDVASIWTFFLIY